MSDHDASRKRAAALREQIAALTGKQPGKAAEPGEAGHRAAPQAYPDQGGSQDSDADTGASRDDSPAAGSPAAAVEPGGAGEEGDFMRRDAPRVHRPSPREFIEQRMREVDRRRDGGGDKE